MKKGMNEYLLGIILAIIVITIVIVMYVASKEGLSEAPKNIQQLAGLIG